MSQAKYYSPRLRRDLVSKVVLESEIARCPNDEPPIGSWLKVTSISNEAVLRPES